MGMIAEIWFRNIFNKLKVPRRISQKAAIPSQTPTMAILNCTGKGDISGVYLVLMIHLFDQNTSSFLEKIDKKSVEVEALLPSGERVG